MIVKSLQKLALRVFLVFIGLTTSLLVLEIGMRLYYLMAENQFLGLTPARTTLKFYDDDIFGYVLVPNQKGWFVPHTREYFTWVEANSYGFPDVEHTLQKPPNTLRILLLGDSFAENYQVPLEKRFFRQLETTLKTITKRPIEVIVLGLGNSGTARQLLLLQNFGVSYKPDLVVHMFLTANDVKNNSPVLQMDPYTPYFRLNEQGDLVQTLHQKRSGRKFSKIKDTLKELRIVELLLAVRQKFFEDQQNRAAGYPLDYHVYDKIYTSEYEEAWAVTKKLILETKKETENAGAKYVLVVLANNEQVNLPVREKILNTYTSMQKSKLDFEKPDKILQEFCKETNIECLFMLPYFKEYVTQHPDKPTHNRLEGHWNQTGTNLAAEFLIKILPNYFSIK